MMMILFSLGAVGGYGIILLIIGLLLRFLVARNRFNRRGIGGLQQYSSYPKALVVSAFEFLLKLIGTLLLIGGVLLCWVDWYNHRTAEKFRQQQLQQQSR